MNVTVKEYDMPAPSVVIDNVVYKQDEYVFDEDHVLWQLVYLTKYANGWSWVKMYSSEDFSFVYWLESREPWTGPKGKIRKVTISVVAPKDSCDA